MVAHSDISIDLRSDRVDGSKTIECIDKAIAVLNENLKGSPEGEISSCLDKYQLELLRIKVLISFDKHKEAYDRFYSVFSTQSIKSISLDAFVLEAELVLKVDEDFEKSKNMLQSVLKQDELHFQALLLSAYIYIFYEARFQYALDCLMRAKMVNPKSHELWNLMGHAYSFIDGVSDKVEECFVQASVVQLETPEALQIINCIPFKVSDL